MVNPIEMVANYLVIFIHLEAVRRNGVTSLESEGTTNLHSLLMKCRCLKLHTMVEGCIFLHGLKILDKLKTLVSFNSKYQHYKT